MQLKEIHLRVQNGLDFQTFKKEVLDIAGLNDVFRFTESTDPEFIVFGPYGNDVPAPGPYTRIGYFCENIQPDLSVCEWAFGVPGEQRVNSYKYRRIQWHGLDPAALVKKDWDAEQIFSSKNRFCNFFYSHPVKYREEFFRQLSKYKKVDAPGKSMNNMPPVDGRYAGGKWEAKRQFLSEYKFTIACENYVYPGYQTEKLYDAMLAKSIPIYCGDPDAGDIFNTKSFVFVNQYARPANPRLVKFLEQQSQLNFTDIRPLYYKSPADRLRRKLKSIGRNAKMAIQFKRSDFSDVIDRIVMLDKDPEKYMACLNEPWFHNNTPPAGASLRDRWIEIFLENGA